MTLRWLILAWSCVGLARAQAPPDSLQWLGPERLATTTERFELQDGQRELRLAQPFATELLAARLDGISLAAGEDVRLIPVHSILRLRAPAQAGQLLEVEYRFDPLGAVAQHWLHDAAARMPLDEADAVAVADSIARSAPSTPASLRAGQDLRVSGSKTVSVQGGTNRSASVDQALRLSVHGQLTEGVQVRAEISDENLPITPEGNTEELSDLDQVRIELYGRRGRVLLGDFVLRNQESSFVPYERKLQGLALRGVDERARVSLLAGAPEGERVEREFHGREGVQGPYELLDGGRVDQIFIVAGSERVWLDGIAMTRGEERDYTIDYVRGTLRFTERQPIGPERRIAVDFETSRSGYSRSVLGARVDSLQLGDWSLGAFLLREADDPDRPTDGALSPGDRDSLAAAGDDAAGARGEGVVMTLPGEGHYVERFDNGTRYFEIADSTGGDYDVYFSRVAVGSGDYVLERVGNDGPEYRYVGAGLGDHRIGRQLALPRSHRLAGLSFLRGGPQEGLYLRAEADWSSLDRNQLSGFDDEDNGDLAWRGELATPWWGEKENGIRLRGRAEAIGGDFVSTGRIRPPFFYDRWNLQDDARNRREALEEATLEGRWSGRSSDLEFARLHRSGLYDGRRTGWKLDAPIWNALGYEHDLSFIDAEREAGRKSLRRDRSAAMRWQRRVSPWLRLFDEHFRDQRSLRSTGYRSEGYEVGSRWQIAGGLDSRLQFTRQLADSLRSDGESWSFTRDVRRWEGGGRLQRGAWTASLDANLRDTRVAGDAFERSRLGNVRLSRRAPSAATGFDLSYRAGSDQSRVQQREVIFVGIGEGDYDAEGNPVGVRQGDYTVAYTPSDSTVRATDVELRLTADVAFPFPGGGALSRGLLQVRERNRSSDLWAVLRLSPSLLRDDATTVLGEQRLRQELDLLRGIRGHDLRLSYEERLVLDQRFLGLSERSARRLRESRYDWALLEAFQLRNEVGDEFRERSAPMNPNPLLANYRVHDLWLRSTLRWRADAHRQLSLGASFTRRRETLSELEQRIFELLPRAELPLLRGRWVVEFRWARIEEEPAQPSQRPYFFELPGNSRRLGLNAQWELGAAFTIAARYQLRDEAGRILRHDLALETRARF